MGGISKSQISHICKEIDQQVQAFLNRHLQVADYAYLYLNATYLKGRLGKAQQVCSRAIWLKVGDGETEAFRPQRTQRLRSPPGGRCHNPRPPASQAPAAQHTSANERKMMCDFQVELHLERYAPEWLALQELGPRWPGGAQRGAGARPGPGDRARPLADPHDRGNVRSGAGPPGLGGAVGVRQGLSGRWQGCGAVPH